MRSSVIGLVVLALSGCASGGSGGEDGTVPVYLTADDVPCEYEVIGAVRETASVTVGSSTRAGDSYFGHVQERTLGQAGARAGASAVIVVEPSVPREAVAVVKGSTRRVWTTFEGQAVRYLDPTCGLAAQR